MALLLDTQILVWIGSGNPRLPDHVRRQILDADATLFVSAVTAWEFVELEDRFRFPDGVSFAPIIDRLDARLLDYPADAWKVVRHLPKIHLDPVDRMVIAHAILAESSLSFLGLGLPPPTASWGLMLKEVTPFLQLQPMAAFFPGLTISLIILGFNLLGDGLRDIFDPRQYKR